MKPSGRREGQEGGKRGRKETKGNEEQTKRRSEKETGGGLSIEKKTIHLKSKDEKGHGSKSNGWIDRLIKKDGKARE